MEDWLWKFPNLPQMPQHLVDAAYKCIDDAHKSIVFNNVTADSHTSNMDSETFIQNGVVKSSTAFVQYKLDQEILDWIYANIIDSEYGNLRITRSTIDPNGGEKHKIAHTDATRDYVLIYLLESGGENHRTVWYREKNQPLIRERHYRVSDYNLLEELGSISIPLHRWILLHSKILHAVENIPNHRISFQLGINNIEKIKSPIQEWTND